MQSILFIQFPWTKGISGYLGSVQTWIVCHCQAYIKSTPYKIKVGIVTTWNTHTPCLNAALGPCRTALMPFVEQILQRYLIQQKVNDIDH